MNPAIDFFILLRNKSDEIIGAARVDMADAVRFSRFRWGVNSGYASRKERGKVLLMHRLIAKTPIGMDTDHINGDRSDNRRCNLRHATRTQNQCNRGPDLGGASQYKGVDFMPKKGKWRARISAGGERRFLGLYSTHEEAASVYDAACRIAHGSFARPNLN